MLAELIHFVASIGPIRRVLRRWQGKGAILCFHRVIPSQMLEVGASPTRNLSFDATKFRMLLAALKKEYQFVSLDRFLDSDQVGKEHRSQIAVTFDDGYRDYLDYALPILDALNIPSTIFLTTRFLESDRSMWWYELRDFIVEAKSIEISHAGKSRIRNCRTTHEKCRCFIEIRALIMQMSDQELNHFMVEFTGKRYRKEYPEICMDWNDVRRIDSNPLVTVGSHGWAHLNYSYETREVVLEDMVRSKLLIEKNIGHKIRHMAYPYGTFSEVTEREIELAEEAGFRSAVTTECFKTDQANRFCLPRYGVIDKRSYASLQTRIGGLSNFLRRQVA